jgi:hypothetical protein
MLLQVLCVKFNFMKFSQGRALSREPDFSYSAWPVMLHRHRPRFAVVTQPEGSKLISKTREMLRCEDWQPKNL